jgi:Trk K+ transport system NAD-binding subunit
LQTINLPSDGLRDHVVIAGGGRVGSAVAQVLQRIGRPFVVIELDQRRVDGLKRDDMPIIYGDAVRDELYAPLYEMHSDYQVLAQLRGAARLLDLGWVTVPEGSPLAGQSLRKLDIRRTVGVSVVGVLRDGNLNANPPGSFRLAAGDATAVIGDREKVAEFEARAQPNVVSAAVA